MVSMTATVRMIRAFARGGLKLGVHSVTSRAREEAVSLPPDPPGSTPFRSCLVWAVDVTRGLKPLYAVRTWERP